MSVYTGSVRGWWSKVWGGEKQKIYTHYNNITIPYNWILCDPDVLCVLDSKAILTAT